METNKSKFKLTKDSPIVKIIAVVILLILGLATKYPYDVVSWFISLLYLTAVVLFIIIIRGMIKTNEIWIWKGSASQKYRFLGMFLIFYFTPDLQKKSVQFLSMNTLLERMVNFGIQQVKVKKFGLE